MPVIKGCDIVLILTKIASFVGARGANTIGISRCNEFCVITLRSPQLLDDLSKVPHEVGRVSLSRKTIRTQKMVWSKIIRVKSG